MATKKQNEKKPITESTVDNNIVEETFNEASAIVDKTIDENLTPVVEEVPAGENPEEAPKEEVPAEEKTEEAPKEEVPAGENTEEAPKEEVPADENTEEAPKELEDEEEFTDDLAEVDAKIKAILKSNHNYSFLTCSRHLKNEITDKTLKLFYDEFVKFGINTKDDSDLIELFKIKFD